MNNNFGFIIIRHVNSNLTNLYWILCYKSIRIHYSNKIIIIDDNSKNEFIDSNFEKNLENTEIIQSEYPGSGEILGYYYYYIHNFFNRAIILHDSTFIQKKINFDSINYIKFLWHFDHKWDNQVEELELINNMDIDYELKNKIFSFYFEKNKWNGCYGIQSVIDYSFLKKISEKYNLFSTPRLIEYIHTRKRRMNMERIFGLICSMELLGIKDSEKSLYGIIHNYIQWGYTFQEYIQDTMKNNSRIANLPIVKVWTGR
jgi:hypothetical protein